MGLTETAAPCFTNPLDPGRRKIGSPGQAFGNEAKVVDAEGNTLPPEAPGEIMVRGPNVMKGYYKAPEETVKALTSDGWLHTGDLAYVDKEGFFFITGRIKELIIKGGENIAPREIDDVLLQHPAVGEAVAFGTPHAAWGEEVAAAVVLKSPATEKELVAFARERLADHKVPKKLYLVEKIPRTATGKIQRRSVAEALQPR